MSLIVDRESGAELLAPMLHPSQWTVAVAAAGRGTRLGFDKPKILFHVGGLSILERLVNLFRPLCGEFVFILSPDGAPVVEPHIRALVPHAGRIAIQPEPKGMGHAVACGIPSVNTPFVVVVWGDQFALRPSSLEFCMRLLEGCPEAEAVCPTLLRGDPYIHFVRESENGRVTTVLQRREGDILPEEGESDSGVFFFRTSALQRRLTELLGDGSALGHQTKEQNFLPIFPLVDTVANALITPRIMTETESTGINSREDAAYIEARLSL